VVDSSGKKVKRKQATLKTRKFIGSSKRGGGVGGDSDGDDDFMPTKKAAAAKARKPIAPVGGASRTRPREGEDCSDMATKEMMKK
jgi:DNA topoisomerase-2